MTFGAPKRDYRTSVLRRPSYPTHTRRQKSRAYTRTRLVPTRADRPYGSFPPRHHQVAPDPGGQPATQRTRVRAPLRRALSRTAGLAPPPLLLPLPPAPPP